jgi:hypothetical protein
LIDILNFTSTGIFLRKALLKYLLFVLRQCVLCYSYHLGVLNDQCALCDIKISQSQPNSHFRTSRKRADFFQLSVLLVRRNRFAISLYQLSFVLFIFFVPPEICNAGTWLLAHGCQGGFGFARRIGPGNVGG